MYTCTDSSRYPIDQYMNPNSLPYWKNCNAEQIFCYTQYSHPNYQCVSYDNVICDGGHSCLESISMNRYIDEEYCDDFRQHSGKVIIITIKPIHKFSRTIFILITQNNND